MTEPTPQRTASIVASNLVDPPVNPNHVSPEGQLELERAIRRHGFNQPILVRPLKGKGKKALDKYEIIDGCHRRNAMVAIYGPDVYADISDLPILNDINGGGMTVREARELIAEIDRLRAIEVASRKMIEAILGGLTQFGSGI